MTIAHEEIKQVMREFDPSPETNAIAADFYRKLSIRTYADAIRLSPCRTPALNERAIEAALEFREKAVLLGAKEEAVDVPFYNLRRHWVPRLAQARV